jgi:cytochrome c553
MSRRTTARVRVKWRAVNHQRQGKIMKRIITSGVFLVAAATGVAFTGNTFAGNIDAGRELAKKTCATCHGVDGNTTMTPDTPKLAGQPADYLVKSLQGYKSGIRKNPLMAPMAANLSQRDIEDLAAYFSHQQGLVTFK